MKTIAFTVINDLNFDQRMVRICTSLQKAGYNCVLVGRKLPNSQPLIERTYRQKRLNCLFDTGKIFYIEYNLRLLFYLLWLKMDAICSIDVDTVLPGLIISKIRGKKHIFDAHEIFTHVPEVVSRPQVQKVWEWVQKKAFQKTGMAYTVGPALANYFKEQYGRKVEVVRNMPLTAKKMPYTPDADRFILYQGALNKGRGLEALIEAMCEIPCKLVIAGGGDIEVELHNLVDSLNLKDKVKFLGFVLPDELPKLTTRAYIGINVSENAGLSYYLSLNNKFFDYIQAGLPSLINDFPEYVILNDEYKVGVITESVVSNIVQNANLILQDENLHTRLNENCLRTAQELNWEKEELHLVAIYKEYFEQK